MASVPGEGVAAVLFLPDGRTLATGDVTGRVRLWDVADRREVGAPAAHAKEVTALAASPDGTLLASADEGTVKLWDLATQSERSTLKGGARCLTFLEGGRVLVTGGDRRPTLIWDPATGHLVKDRPVKALQVQPDAVLCLAASADGQTLALGCRDRTIRLWDLGSGQLRGVLTGHTREVTALAFRSDGSALVSAAGPLGPWFAQGGEVKIWDADPAEPAAE
jgi:WD40 repeat protein